MSTRSAMLYLAGDDIESVATQLSEHIGWGNGAVFAADDRCNCPQCEQERDDVRAAILSAIAPIIARIWARVPA